MIRALRQRLADWLRERRIADLRECLDLAFIHGHLQAAQFLGDELELETAGRSPAQWARIRRSMRQQSPQGANP